MREGGKLKESMEKEETSKGSTGGGAKDGTQTQGSRKDRRVREGSEGEKSCEGRRQA